MTTNLMMNRKFDEKNLILASDILRANDKWSIFTHKKSDGDAIGSASALFEAGINLGKQVKWYTPDKSLPEAYRFLAHTDDFISCDNFDFNTDDDVLYVFLDCSNEIRGVLGFDTSKDIKALNIDHHEDNTLFGQVNCVDGLASSTCEMLYRIFKAAEWNITNTIAESLYTGIFTDTGGFSFSNTSALTHRIAAELIDLGVKSDKISDFIHQNKTPSDFLIWARAMSRVKIFGDNNIFAIAVIYAKDFEETGAEINGTEGLSSMFMTIKGVKLISTITQYPGGEIRLSIRSREGSPFGAGELARMFGGGGHERAAGATFNVPIDKAAEELEKIIMSKYHECTDISK